MRNENAELIRKKHRYRKLILSGRVRLPRHAAVPLIGPDCAYHLYSPGRSCLTAAADNSGKTSSEEKNA